MHLQLLALGNRIRHISYEFFPPSLLKVAKVEVQLLWEPEKLPNAPPPQ